MTACAINMLIKVDHPGPNQIEPIQFHQILLHYPEHCIAGPDLVNEEVGVVAISLELS